MIIDAKQLRTLVRQSSWGGACREAFMSAALDAIPMLLDERDEMSAKLVASEASSQELRSALWIMHGHFSALYGDDGEMQCAECPCDYKRDPVAVVVAAATKARQVQHAASETARSKLEGALRKTQDELRECRLACIRLVAGATP